MNKSRLMLGTVLVLCGGIGAIWVHHANVAKHRRSLDAAMAQKNDLLLRESELSSEGRDISEELPVELAENTAELTRQVAFGLSSTERIATLKRQHLNVSRKVRQLLDLLNQSIATAHQCETALNAVLAEEHYFHQGTSEAQGELQQIQGILRTDADSQRKWQNALPQLDATYAELEARANGRQPQ